MALEIIPIKCSCCGAPLPVEKISDGATVVECEHCTNVDSIVWIDENKINKDEIRNLCEQAEGFMEEDRFDDALENYEDVIGKFRVNNPEIYWRALLARYGIRYVWDEKGGIYLPTINRMSKRYITLDGYYKKTLEYADSSQKAVYQEKAKQINAILGKIIDIASKEEPYDVFICYKDKDETGRPTEDSVYAERLYNRLHNKEGFNVFFSRYTLREKAGSEYEPYIFAAIHSARIMIVVGTKSEYLTSPWVKNEWSRFNYLAEGKRSGETKVIFALYKDMELNDIPLEIKLQHLRMEGDWLENIVNIVYKNIPGKRIEKPVIKEVVKPAPIMQKIGVRCTGCNTNAMIDFNGKDEVYECPKCHEIVSIEEAKKNFSKRKNQPVEKKTQERVKDEPRIISTRVKTEPPITATRVKTEMPVAPQTKTRKESVTSVADAYKYEREYKKALKWFIVTIVGLVIMAMGYTFAKFTKSQVASDISFIIIMTGLAAAILTGYLGNCRLDNRRSEMEATRRIFPWWWILWIPALVHVITVILSFILGQGYVLDFKDSPSVLSIISLYALVLGLLSMIALSVIRFVYSYKDYHGW